MAFLLAVNRSSAVIVFETNRYFAADCFSQSLFRRCSFSIFAGRGVRSGRKVRFCAPRPAEFTSGQTIKNERQKGFITAAGSILSCFAMNRNACQVIERYCRKSFGFMNIPANRLTETGNCAIIAHGVLSTVCAETDSAGRSQG